MDSSTKMRAKILNIGRLLVDMAPKKMPKTMARIKDPIASARVKRKPLKNCPKS